MKRDKIPPSPSNSSFSLFKVFAKPEPQSQLSKKTQQVRKMKYFSSQHSRPKPGTITKVRGAQYALPIQSTEQNKTLTTDNTDSIDVDENKLIATITKIEEATTPKKSRRDSFSFSLYENATPKYSKKNISNKKKSIHDIHPSPMDSFKPVVQNVNSLVPQNPRGLMNGNVKDLSTVEKQSNSTTISKLERFQKLLAKDVFDIEELRKLSWAGIPSQVRPLVWKLLTGYLPCASERRQAIMEKKKKEYFDLVDKYYHESGMKKSEYEIKTQRLIKQDVPRTNPELKLFRHDRIQGALERILYIWSIRHPGSGYVQGLNDLVTPFMVVFLSDSIGWYFVFHIW